MAQLLPEQNPAKLKRVKYPLNPGSFSPPLERRKTRTITENSGHGLGTLPSLDLSQIFLWSKSLLGLRAILEIFTVLGIPWILEIKTVCLEVVTSSTPTCLLLS